MLIENGPFSPHMMPLESELRELEKHRIGISLTLPTTMKVSFGLIPACLQATWVRVSKEPGSGEKTHV